LGATNIDPGVSLKFLFDNKRMFFFGYEELIDVLYFEGSNSSE